MKIRILLLLFLSLPLSVSAEIRHYLSHQLAEGVLSIQTNQVDVQLTAFSAAAIETRYVTGNHAKDNRFPSQALLKPKPTNIQLTDSDDRLTFSLPGIKAVIHKQPFAIAYYRDDQLLLREEQGFYATDETIGFRFRLTEEEKLIGGGERVLGMDRRGHRLPLYNKASYGYTTHAEQMYFGLPAVLSSRKYILLFDNTARGFADLGKNDKDIMQFEAVSGRTAYVVVAGESYPQLVKNYVSVTGTQPLPPRWAFGSFASRFGYHTAGEARNVIALYRQQQIPLDAIVLDLYWFGADIQGHMGNLDWDLDAFPQPQKMIAEFQQQGVDTILITEPFILSSSKRWQEAVDENVLAKDLQGQPKRFDFYFGNTGLIDIFDDHAQDWFWGIYRNLLDQGVTGLWGDLGEPEVHPADTLHALGSADEWHNAYGHKWAEMLFRRHERDYPERRPMIMMRSGFAGSQRYGMIPWTGDVSRSWGGLQPQVELSLQMGLLGLAYTHSDLGGFAGGESFDAELYTRWLQYGVFQPVFRPHAQEQIASEPVFHPPAIQAMARQQINLRYRMLPYLYTLAWQNSTTGLPLARPLMFSDESNLDLMDNSSSYLWGDALLVTPITQPGIRQQAVSLPQGVWFDFWNDTRYDGGKDILVDLTMESIPVMVKAGAFIPMLSHNIPNTKAYSTEQLTLHYYADKSVTSAHGQMYEDDGNTHRAYDKQQYELLTFSARQKHKSLTLELIRQGFDYQGRPAQRQVTLKVHNWSNKPRRVRVNGKNLNRKYIQHQSDSGLLTLNVDWPGERIKLSIN